MLEGTNSFWYNGRYLKEKRSDMTQIIDGKALAAKLQGQLAEKTARLKEENRFSTWFGGDFGWGQPCQPSLRSK